MAGGTFTSYNKALPGAYFNFESVPRSSIQIGDRGIATIPIELNWGATGKLIDVYSEELQNGDSLAAVGFTAYDAESKVVNLMLQNCALVRLYRINGNGAKATKTVGELTVTAKYSGTFGNEIIISIVENGELFEVNTFVKGELKNTQTVATVQELENNDFVDFSGTGALTANAGIMLSGGTNGETPAKSTYYPDYLALLETANYQTMACPDLTDEDATLKANVTTFIKNQRDKEGRYVQGVVANYYQADYEGIISVKNGVVINGVNFSKEEMAAVFAAMTAGATITQSNTNKTITGATDVIGRYKNSQLIDAHKNGEVVFVPNARGEITVMEDINTYHTFISKKNEAFSLNQCIRILDDIGIQVKDKWEQAYMGKQPNNADGRDIFRAEIDTYFIKLLNAPAIQEYNGVEDITIRQGEKLDDVYVDVDVMPVVAMARLYMTVKVIG